MKAWIAAALTLALVAVAQSATAQGAPTTGFGPPPPPPEPEAVAPPSEPLPQTLRETFGDWSVLCSGETKFCEMRQLARNTDGSPAGEISIIRLPREGGLLSGITINLPLGVLLQPGLVLRVDESEPERYDYQYCTENGCIVRFGYDEAGTTALKRGSEMQMLVSAINLPQNPVRVSVSLTGFTAAYNSLNPQIVQ